MAFRWLAWQIGSRFRVPGHHVSDHHFHGLAPGLLLAQEMWLAKSVIDEPMPDGWGMSRSGGISALRGHTDLPIFLDETAAVRGGRKCSGEIIGEMTDVLAGGRPDMLDAGWMAERQPGNRGRAIRSIVLATTEGRLDPGRRRGQRARLIEVPAGRPGSFGVIDYPERMRPAIGSFEEAGEHIERLSQAATRNYGYALPLFISCQIEHRAEVPAWTERDMRVFLKASGAAGRDGWTRSVLACFALVYATAMLARRFRVVPWPRAEILDAVLRCCGDALREATAGHEAGAEAHAAEAAERIRRWIADDARFAARVGSDFDPGRVEEYDVIYDHDRGEAATLVQRDRLVEVAGGEQALSAVLDHAKQKDWLAPNRKTGAVTRQKRFAGTEGKLRFVYFRKAFLKGAKL